MDSASLATQTGVALDGQLTSTQEQLTGQLPTSQEQLTGQLAAADGQLAVAVGAIVGVGGAVADGAVRLTEDAAQRILQAVGTARTELAALLSSAEQDLSTPLMFGNNFVGRAIAERLRGVANGGSESAVGVVTQFADVLDQVEATIRAAAGLLTDTDEAAGQTMRQLGGQR